MDRHPDTEEDTDENYGPLKVACEVEVQGAFSGRALIVRPGFIVEPHDRNGSRIGCGGPRWAGRCWRRSPRIFASSSLTCAT
jgi:hypothetical protein